MSSAPQLGPYVLDRRIAVGGTSEVYLAHAEPARPGTPKQVVVKRLLPDFQSDLAFFAMFEREAKLQAMVDHPNVVQVLDHGEHQGEPFLVTEHVDGIDAERLLRRLQRNQRLLPADLVAHIGCELASALAAVHEARSEHGEVLGIVHRDISPSNVYFARDGAVKLGDFGLAHALHQAEWRSETGHALRGKFAYLSPEQVAGDPSDQRSDLFSLGSLLAELLMGSPLFPGKGQLAVLLAIRDARIDALLDLQPTQPLVGVLRELLARLPERRIPSARALHQALQPFAPSPHRARERLAAELKILLALSSHVSLPKVPSSAVVATSTHPLRRGSLVAGAHPLGHQPGDSQIPPAVAAKPWPPTPDTDPSPAAASGAVVPPAGPVAPASDQLPAQAAPRTSSAVHAATQRSPLADPDSDTARYRLGPTTVHRRDGSTLGPYTFAVLVEALCTGALDADDMVEDQRGDRVPIHAVDELRRFLPPSSRRSSAPAAAVPEYSTPMTPLHTLDVLGRLYRDRATGSLFAERAGTSVQRVRGDLLPHKKEIYIHDGKVHHVASSERSEMLGEYLCRHGMLTRRKLDVALAALPRYDGKMGDTLIALGLCDPVVVFRAIRTQGRDRVVDLFRWHEGELVFRPLESMPAVGFPLELSLLDLMLAGLEVVPHGRNPASLDPARMRHRLVLVEPLAPSTGTLAPAFTLLLSSLQQPRSLGELLQHAESEGYLSAGDVARAAEVLVAAGVLRWVVEARVGRG